MSTTSPPFADVVHLDVGAGRPLPTPGPLGRRALVVLWDGDRPVGQLRVAPGEDPGAAIRSFEPPAEVPSRTTGRPRTASVVICTRDRADQLERCLASLPRQSRPPDEVIVVDNASLGSETRRVALAAGARYVREDRPGLDIARNTGLRSAASDVVAYTDDDTELHPRWLERLVAAFDREDVMAVTGLVLPATLDTEARWLFEEQWGFGRGFLRTDFGPEWYLATRTTGSPTWEFGAGANMAFRRSVADTVGFFDQRLDVGAAGCSGDSEYWYRILAAGGTCRYEPSAVLFHHHRSDLDGLRDQIFHYMRGHVAALLVQYERTGDVGNLRRLTSLLPVWFWKRFLTRVRRGRRPDNRLLGTEVLGAVAGVLYYGSARWLRRIPRDPLPAGG